MQQFSIIDRSLSMCIVDFVHQSGGFFSYCKQRKLSFGGTSKTLRFHIPVTPRKTFPIAYFESAKETSTTNKDQTRVLKHSQHPVHTNSMPVLFLTNHLKRSTSRLSKTLLPRVSMNQKIQNTQQNHQATTGVGQKDGQKEV